MATAFIAWLIACGPVASTDGGLLPAASRTTLQIAPATVFGFESDLTFSIGLAELATSLTEELAM